MDTARKTPRERVALGFLGALLFSLAGTAVYVFFCYEGYYPWPAGGAAPVAAILGYGIFSGKKGSGKGLIAATVFSVLALLLGAYLSLVIDLHNALQEEHMAATTGQLFLLTLALLLGYNAWGFTLDVLAWLPSFGVSLAVCAVVIFGRFSALRKEKKRALAAAQAVPAEPQTMEEPPHDDQSDLL